ncbi:MAG: glycosyltransferase family 2 protein [Deltaproteobacteria bacterium]|nr:glycosyltransferase family 2 protein [Deltaproteobacteria bacterium]
MGALNDIASISVVVPTYRREETLCETIRAILKLRYPEWELIIIDQNKRHKPSTEDFLSSLPPRVRRIKLEKPNLPAARNVGAREAKGSIVLYLDDDITPLPGLLNAHARHYTNPIVGGVAGRLISPTGVVRQIDPRYYVSRLPWLYIRFDQDWGLREVETAPGGNMSFRRELIFQAGFFDEQFVGNAFREETDFCIRLRNLSYRIIFDPDAALFHHFGTPGGCENLHLNPFNQVSFPYYKEFFHNNAYFFFKHIPLYLISRPLWDIYREHVANKTIISCGIKFIVLRHIAFMLGLAKGWKSWRRYWGSRCLH